MLIRLHIQNYAIIDELEINFSEGLNVITGETGAGKSILMGALNLILGQRADSTVLHDTTRKCLVEGVFSQTESEDLRDFFLQNDLDFENETVIRREVAANGKSRSFINDTPVNLTQVKKLSVLLADLHQQFDTLDINTEDFQLSVIDAMADHTATIKMLKHQFQQYDKTRHELAVLRKQQENIERELDYHTFLYEELETLSLKENELELSDAELKLLYDAEHIKMQLSGLYNALNYSEHPLIQQLKSVQQKLSALKEYHPSIVSLSERMLSAIVELKDIAEDLESIENNIRYDGERIQLLNERVAAGYKLFKKHGVNSTSELIGIQQELQTKLNGYTNITDTISRLEHEEKTLLDTCLKTASRVSEKRKSIVDDFVEKINALLVQVGMPNARLKVNISASDLKETGMDRVDFLFDANKTGKFEPLGRVASGGELSRLMLSVKSLVASKLDLPTLIFDEIDTGISGEAARQVGLIMKTLSNHHQLIAITHQPQIAAKARSHYFVYKEIVADKIKTSVRTLNEDERIIAIAKMLSGEKPSAAAMENAREMVAN